MKLLTNSFRGEAPAVTPRGLPDNAAQIAINARLQSGDLEAWRQFLLEKELANGGPVQTIYKLNDEWLSWDEQVDVARGLIPGDTTYRTFLTCPSLYDRPQFTTYALATTGAEPFPVTTRPLGVDSPEVAPTLAVGVDTSPDATFAVDILDEGGDLGQWSNSGITNEATFTSAVEADPTLGNPTPSYRITVRDFEYGTYMKRNFGIANAATARLTFDFIPHPYAGIHTVFAGVMRNEAGEGGITVRIDLNSLGWYLTLGTGANWSQGKDISVLVQEGPEPGGTVPVDALSRCRIDVVRNADNTQTVTCVITDLSDVALVGPLSTTMTAEIGDWCGFGAGLDQLGGNLYTSIDNIHVQASGTFGYAPILTATSYVFTYENDLAQQSAPSLPSATISRPDGVSVTITTPTTLPAGYSDYGITTKVIYRAVTGAGGTEFKVVARIPFAQADFVDTLNDEETGPEVLVSEGWELPPDELEGIIALPNDTMAGFFRNQLCFSAQGYPHAWPVAYRKTTDTNIVAISNIDTTVVVGTLSFVYTATGSSPDAYSMSKPGEAQSCVSKRGMVFVDGLGVAFPSPDGYQLCRGSAGSVENMTDKVFTRRQWSALRPETIIAAVHDGVLHFFHGTVSGPSDAAGHALDVKPQGFGLIRLGYHATASHSDPITDHLYLVLDDVDEPEHELLPEASTAVTPDGTTIYQFDGDEDSSMVFQWRGKLNLMPWPTVLHYSKIQAGDYTNLVFITYADGVEIDAFRVLDDGYVRLPGLDTKKSYEFELIGTSPTRTFQASEKPEEFT